jgi:hypothetical protein
MTFSKPYARKRDPSVQLAILVEGQNLLRWGVTVLSTDSKPFVHILHESIP